MSTDQPHWATQQTASPFRWWLLRLPIFDVVGVVLAEDSHCKIYQSTPPGVRLRASLSPTLSHRRQPIRWRFRRDACSSICSLSVWLSEWKILIYMLIFIHLMHTAIVVAGCFRLAEVLHRNKISIRLRWTDIFPKGPFSLGLITPFPVMLLGALG